MLVLFDNGTPRTLARYLIDRHTITEARSRGCEELENGELLDEAEAGLRSAGHDRQKSQLSAEPCAPQNSHCRVRKRTLDRPPSACGAEYRSGKRGETRQLC